MAMMNNSEKKILSVSPIDISMEILLSALHLDREHELIDDIITMHRAAIETAKPVAVFAPYPVDARDGVIRLNNVMLDAPFVYEKLSACDIVIPFVASCGNEIDEWSKTLDDSFEQFVADILKQLCLKAIGERLFSEVREKYFNDGEISTINPGSLAEWPIANQHLLFEILGGVTGDIGVVLSDSCLMSPTKSWSGIMFQTEKVFHNCQLCPRTDCPNRKTPYIGN